MKILAVFVSIMFFANTVLFNVVTPIMWHFEMRDNDLPIAQ